jgi:hypothetical protein
MTLIDKAKVAAEKAAARAQQGVAQGHAKLDAIQSKRRADALLRDLGAAYYAELRDGGSRDAVDTVVAALDAHAADNGAVDTSADPGDGESAPDEHTSGD